MQAEMVKLPWNLQVRAKAKHLGFSFKLRLNLPKSDLKLHRFSLLLKLRRWRLQVESDSGSPAMKTELRRRSSSVRSKFIKIFHRLRSRFRIRELLAPAEKSVVPENRLAKCAAFSLVLVVVALVSSLGFDVAKLIELR